MGVGGGEGQPTGGTTKGRQEVVCRGLTVRMPHLAADKAHGGRHQRVVLGKAQLGREDAALKGRALGALDDGLPEQHVVLGDGAGGDAVGRVVGEGAVLLEEAAVGGGRHGGRGCVFGWWAGGWPRAWWSWSRWL